MAVDGGHRGKDRFGTSFSNRTKKLSEEKDAFLGGRETGKE